MTPTPAYVHLHCHTHYSMLDGAAPVDALLDEAARLGMPALAMTDHGNMFGAVEFYSKAKDRGLKPIVGMEAYTTPGSRRDRRPDDPINHLTLLARDGTGYRNLIKLSTAAYLDGFYYKPRIDRELLAAHSEGLIILTGCLKSEFNEHLRAGKRDEALRFAGALADLAGRENVYLEVMNNGMPEQVACGEQTFEIARELNLPVVLTSDVHYLRQDDAVAHDCLVCINTGKTLSDEHRMKMSSDQFWFRPPDVMTSCYPDRPEILANTVEVANRCELKIPFGEYHMPRFETPDGKSVSEYFRDRCLAGLARRYGASITEDIRNRLDYEMDVIQKMGYESYFLIVWDFIRHAREIGVPVGPGRGSAAGSLVAYCLEITNIDPLRYDLLFERFLNPSRISMPDIDIDFCKLGRERVIDYVRKKYGEQNVSQIITYGTLKAKAAIRDVGRVLGVPLSEVDKIAKKVPEGPKVELAKALEQDAELRALSKDPRYAQLFEIAGRLEGLNRNAGTHAAGVVIADAPLTEYLPLYVNKEQVATQYSMEYIEKIGLLKMDFLGLNTLTLIDKALANIARLHGEAPDLSKIPLDDKAAFALLCKADTQGVFQLESDGMSDLVGKLAPQRFEDIIALVALYRPGPLNSGMVDAFVNRRHGREKVKYDHPILEEILAETYGTMVYQEQVMRVTNKMADFSLAEADSMRKAMGKKKPEIMVPFRDKFIQGSAKHGVPERVAAKIWEDIVQFAEYGFNKSHSAAYGLVAYQTAWLKANYRKEFLAALLSVEIGNYDKVAHYVSSIRQSGGEVLPPDVNRSIQDFAVEGEAIRYGLGGVKGVGERAIESIVAARESRGDFRSVLDLCESVDLRLCNKATMEALVKSGAMDGLGQHRAQLVAAVDEAMKKGQVAQRDRDAGQSLLFGAMPEPGPAAKKSSAGGGGDAAPLPEVPEWPEAERLALEKEVLGFYLSGHPLEKHAKALKLFSTHDIGELAGVPGDATVTVAGLLTQVRPRLDKKGKPFAFLSLEDLTASIDAVCFSSIYAESRERLEPDRIVILTGRLDRQREQPSIVVDKVIPLEEAATAVRGPVVLQLQLAQLTEQLERALHELIERHRGGTRLRLEVKGGSRNRVVMELGDDFGLDPSPDAVGALRELLGPASVHFQRVG